LNKETESDGLDELVGRRLDMVFDLAAEKKIKLSDEDIRNYGEYCYVTLDEVNSFISKLIREKYMYLCSPINYNPYAFGDQNDLVPIVYKCEVLDIKLHSVVIKNESVHCSNGFDIRIKDKYILEIEKLSGDLSELHIELYSDDILRLKNKGSIIDYYGDILSLTPDKAGDDLKKYFG
jgi:hypothetical protein